LSVSLFLSFNREKQQHDWIQQYDWIQQHEVSLLVVFSEGVGVGTTS